MRDQVNRLRRDNTYAQQDLQETQAANEAQDVDLSDLERDIEVYDEQIRKAQDEQRRLEQERDKVSGCQRRERS